MTTREQRQAEGDRLRDAGIARADAHAPTDWKERALATIERLARSRSTLTANDVWDSGLSHPPEPRALGAVFRYAAKAGLVESTGAFRRSCRPECHRRPVLVWASRVYREAA